VKRISQLGTTLAVEPQGVTTQKTAFFIVTAGKTSNLLRFLHTINFITIKVGSYEINSKSGKYTDDNSFITENVP
jgi:hypothetical protein